MKITRRQLRKLIKENLDLVWAKRTAAEPRAWNQQMELVKDIIRQGEYDMASSYLQDYPDMLYQIAKDMTQGKSENTNLGYYLTEWLPYQYYNTDGEFDQLHYAATQGMGNKLGSMLASKIDMSIKQPSDLERIQTGRRDRDVIVRRKRK